METSQETVVNGEKVTVIHPQLAETLLQINKKAAEIKDLVLEANEMIAKP